MSGFTMLSLSAADGPVCVDGVCAVPTSRPEPVAEAPDNAVVEPADDSGLG